MNVVRYDRHTGLFYARSVDGGKETAGATRAQATANLRKVVWDRWWREGRRGRY